MAQKQKPPRIVAELGRPETPEETAARRAENSLKHRQRQTVQNLILALGASLLVVLVIVLIVPRSDAPMSHSSQRAASASPRSHSARDCSRVAEPCSSSATTCTSSSRACS